MPKHTFHNLPADKKHRIIEALQTVVLNRPIAKINIADIVRAAGIPRGSIYQYFDGLEDMFGYLIDYSRGQWETLTLKWLSKKRFDFFSYFSMSFDWDIEFYSRYPHQKIIRKFFKESHSYALDLRATFAKKRAFFHQMMALLDTQALKRLPDARVYTLYEQLSYLKQLAIRKTLKGYATKQEAAAEFCHIINIIAKGLTEN